MNVAILYTGFVINLLSDSTLCELLYTIARSPFVLKHIIIISATAIILLLYD